MENPEEPLQEDNAMFEARVDSVSVTNMGFIVFLKGEIEDRVLPIFIGPNEAQSIALALNPQEPPRPMTHDLLKSMLESLDSAVSRVEISDLRDNTFIGRVFLKKSQVEEMEFDARPSDAMALALRFGAPIFVSRKVFAEASVPVVSAAGEGETAEAGEAAAGGESSEPETSAPSMSQAEKLRAALDKAVAEEHYEEAVRLRDLLKKLQAGN